MTLEIFEATCVILSFVFFTRKRTCAVFLGVDIWSTLEVYWSKETWLKNYDRRINSKTNKKKPVMLVAAHNKTRRKKQIYQYYIHLTSTHLNWFIQNQILYSFLMSYEASREICIYLHISFRKTIRIMLSYFVHLKQKVSSITTTRCLWQWVFPCKWTLLYVHQRLYIHMDVVTFAYFERQFSQWVPLIHEGPHRMAAIL